MLQNNVQVSSYCAAPHIHCVLCITKSPTLIRPLWGTSPLSIHLVSYICINLRSQATEVYMSIVNASLKVVIMGKYQAMQTEPSKQISEKKSLYFLPSFADPSKNAACYRLYKIQWEGGQRSTSHNCTVGLYETGSENINRNLAVLFYLAWCWWCSLVPDLFALSRQLLHWP